MIGNSGTQINLWQAESLAFTATGPTTTISLIGHSGFNYIGLDNVSVVQTAAGVLTFAPASITFLTMTAAGNNACQ